MKETVGNREIECRDCADGYSICVDGSQVWWVSYKTLNPEVKAEIAFSAIVKSIRFCEGGAQ